MVGVVLSLSDMEKGLEIGWEYEDVWMKLERVFWELWCWVFCW